MITIQHVLNQKPRHLHHINPDATVRDALERMAEHNIGALVVLDGEGHVCGVVTERDYARKIVLMGRTSLETPVHEIMSRRVIFARPEQSVEESLAVMTARAVRHLPVLDHNTVIGIVSIGDLVKAVIADKEFIIEQLENYIQGDCR